MTNKKKKTLDLTIVGVGASAGGLEALTDLFAHLPISLKENTCFVVAQHMSPTHRSILAQVLAKDTPFRVVEAEDKQKLQAGVIYITPPNSNIEIIQKKIKLSIPDSSQISKPSVDLLLTSLSKDAGKNAIAVILSGAGSDGALGVEKIKVCGGMVIVQNPDTAKYNGMPLAALQTNKADYSVACEKIGIQIEDILLKSLSFSTQKRQDSELQELFLLLYNQFGINLENYKTSTVQRRVEKSMQTAGIESLREYLQFLEKNPAALQLLYQSFPVHVTSFFRDKEAFERLAQTIEEKIAKETLGDTFRVWVAGCSTGEEAFSLAMMIQHLLEQHKYHCILQIFATDIHEEALDIARKATYTAEQIKEVPLELIEKYLVKYGDSYEIEKNLKAQVLFSKHDLTINPPFFKLDVVSCRNLLIYLNNETQRHIFPLFHYALKEDGLLFLGKSESINQAGDLFSEIDTKSKIFKKQKPYDSQLSLKFGGFKPLGFRGMGEKKTPKETSLNYQNRICETFVNLTEHSYLVLNSMLNIVETKGDWSNFIQITEGALNLNIQKLLRQEIATEVKKLVLKVIQDKKNVKGNLKRVFINHKSLYIRLQCGFIGKNIGQHHGELYLLVLEKYDFEEEISRISSNTDNQDIRMSELEEELSFTKEHLQTHIEEIETVNEKLQSLNEELQSSNEELQSSNEELQTAYTEIKLFNKQLELKETHLAKANQLFEALFENTQQGYVLLETNFVIKLLNQEAIRLFEQIGILHIDLNRNIFGFLSESLEKKLYQMLLEAQKTLTTQKEILEVSFLTQKFYYDFHIAPIYHPTEKKILYFSVGILNISSVKQRELDLFHRDEMLLSLLESNSSFLTRTDTQGHYTYVNKAFCEKFGFESQQLIGKHYGSTVHFEDLEDCQKAVSRLIENPNSVVNIQMRKPNPQGGFFYTEWELVAIKNVSGAIVEIQGVGKDITTQKMAQQHLKEEKERLELMIWGGKLGTWDWDLESNTILFNQRWAEMMGYPQQEVCLTFDEWKQTIHPEDLSRVLETLESNIVGNISSYEIEHRKLTQTGEIKHVIVIGKVVKRNEKGKAIRLIGIHQDITDKKRTEEKIKMAESHHKAILDTMQEGMVIQDISGMLIACNPSAEKILGLPQDQILARSYIDTRWKVVREDGSPLPNEEQPGIIALKTGTPQIGVILGVYKPDGELSWISASSQLLFHPENKEPYAIFTVFHDVTERIKAEKELAIEKRRLDEIIKGTHVGTWEWNVQTGEMIYNKRWAEMIGYSVEELDALGEDVLEKLSHPKDLRQSDKMLELHFQGKTSYYECELRLRHKLGHWIWVLDKGKVHSWTEQGKPLRMSGTHLDITDRKQAELLLIKRNAELAETEEFLNNSLQELQFLNQKLLKSEESLNKAQEIAKVGSWEFDLIHHNLVWSRELYHIFEINELPANELYAAYRAKMSASDLNRLDALLQEAQEHGTSYIFEHQIVCKDSHVKYVIGIGEVVCDKNGVAIALRGTLQDITERKKMEMMIQESERKLNILISNFPDGSISLIDAEKLTFLYTGGAGYKQMNIDTTHFIGKPIEEILPPEIYLKIKQALSLVYEHQPVSYEIGFQNHVYLNTIQPIVNEQGKLESFAIVAMDITQRKKTEQQILEQNKRLTEIAFIQSHVLRRPVANIIGLLYLIQEARKSNDMEAIYEYLNFLETSVKETDIVIHQIVEKTNQLDE